MASAKSDRIVRVLGEGGNVAILPQHFDWADPLLREVSDELQVRGWLERRRRDSITATTGGRVFVATSVDHLRGRHLHDYVSIGCPLLSLHKEAQFRCSLTSVRQCTA